jgi:hypothetical protein
MFRCTCRLRQQAAPSFDYCHEEIIVSMSRLTLAEYDHLCKQIAAWIKKNGYVPPVRDLGEIFECSPVTAWRIVRSQGWEAKGHRWVSKKKTEITS